MKLSHYLLFRYAFALLLFLDFNAFGQTPPGQVLTVSASADTMITVHSGLGGANSTHGSDATLYTIGLDGFNTYSLVRFDLSLYDGQTVVADGAFRMYLAGAFPAPAVDRTVNVYEVLINWDAATATYNNFGGSPGIQSGTDVSGVPTATALLSWNSDADDGYRSWTIPQSLLQNWINNPATNRGFLLAIGSGERDLNYKSMEGANPPQLSFIAGSTIVPGLMTLAPGQTNIGVGQSVVFSVSGGQSPRLFSLATNNSGGSIHPFSGVYVSGPIANVIDTVRVTDSRGSNAVATISVLPDLTPRPDLAIHSMLTPIGATSSMPVELIWIVTNRGNATASAPWTERIFLSADAVVGDDRFLAGFINNTALPVGGFLTRTQAVVLPPDSPAGATHFVMEVDADGQVNESSEGNNLAVAAAATAIAPQLFLTPAVGSVPEVAQLAFTVTRNGDRAAALAVTLNSSDIGELTVPVSVTIPAGVATAGFSATGVPDGAFDGTQLATVSASAPGFIGASAAMLVPDADVPHLTLTLATNRVSEGGSVVATVTREVVTAAPLVVDVSNVGGQVAFPALVTIPAGTNATTFAVVAVGDTAVERTTTVTLRVVTPAFLSATANLIVEDDDLPVVTITLANATVGEGAGASATMGTVTRDRNSPRALVIALASGNLNAALVPGNVTMPAGQTQASFTIAAVNDGEVDGTQSALISGIILETGSSFPVGAAVPATLAVTDDDGPALRLTLARELVGEGLNPATTARTARLPSPWPPVT